MKLTAFIATFARIIDKHGDLEVMMPTSEDLSEVWYAHVRGDYVELSPYDKPWTAKLTDPHSDDSIEVRDWRPK